MSKKIAVIGSGISGLVSAYLLSQKHDVYLFEKNDYLGGHTNTVDINLDGNNYAIDTGFIVFNRKTYPNFCNLLHRLNVATEKTEMSFSYSCKVSKIEYNGSNLNTLFADRKNFFSIRFYKMLADVIRFNRKAKEFVIQNCDRDITVEEFMRQGRYNTFFIDFYFIPMVSAIWSASPKEVFEYPAKFILNFFYNHGLLDVRDRPQWCIVKGGSKNYIQPMVDSLKNNIFLNAEVTSIKKNNNGVVLATVKGAHHFDAVIIATHSDQALKILSEPTQQEQHILSAIQYQDNEVVLHYDNTVLPSKKLAWASWNSHGTKDNTAKLTYYMNRLQNIKAPVDFCVSVNNTENINPEKILRRFNYSHPILNQSTVNAQRLIGEINGINNIYYCGAYWGYGFHEDGVKSALTTCKLFGIDL